MAVPSLLAQARTVTLFTSPPNYPLAASESIPLVVDFTARLGVGEAIATATNASAVTVSLTDLRTGLSVPAALSGAASISTATLTQTILGAALASGRRYRFVAAVKELSTGRTEETVTTLVAVVP